MSFESRYYTSKDMYKEYIYKVLCKSIISIGIVVGIIGLIIGIQFINEDGIWSGIILSAAFILLTTAIFTPYVVLKQLLDIDKRLHSGVKYEVVVTFDDKITLVEGAQTVSVEYSQIIKYHKLKTCSVLMFSRQNGILFVEDNFTVGKKEDFDKFIHEKCENLK